MEDPIASPGHAISRLQIASHPIPIDGTSPLQSAEGSAGPSEKPQTTPSPTPAQEPAPTLETLPAEMLRSVAHQLSVPQRISLALASKQTLFKLGLPSRSDWHEISDSPFLPNFLGLRDAGSFAPRRSGTFNISCATRLVVAPDDGCHVDRFARCTTWNGNLILQTTLTYTLSDDPDKMSSLVRLFQEGRTQEREPPAGEKPVDFCCPHVRWTRERPDAFAPLSPARRPLKRVWEWSRTETGTLADDTSLCERCCTVYRCTEFHAEIANFSRKHVVLESWRNLDIANPNIVNSDIASSDIASSDIVNSDIVKMDPITLPAEISSGIQTATHAIPTNPMDLIPPRADLRLHNTSHPIQTDAQPPSDSTRTSEGRRAPPPTLATLPAEVLLDIADHLSPPQRASLALTNKEALCKIGLPSSSAWRREVSDSPFLPWGIRFPDAKHFAAHNHEGYMHTGRTSDYATDGARATRRIGWHFWNGSLVLKTEISFEVVDDPEAAAAAVRLFRMHPKASENPIGFPLEGPLDWCCPHVRWLEAFPQTIATSSPGHPFGRQGWAGWWTKVCDRCSTSYRCAESGDYLSRRVFLESRRVLGRCQTLTDPAWLSQTTQDYPPNSELTFDEWRKLWRGERQRQF